jgi:site-specific DNA-methyltransferase (adenine-specific)
MGKVILGDCRKYLQQIIDRGSIFYEGKKLEPFVDFIFADPPFNIGEGYGTWDDCMPWEEYQEFTFDWLFLCHKVLKGTGSMWIHVPDSIAADIVLWCRDELKMNLVNWCIWHYRFGQHKESSFINSHCHGLWFSKSDEWTWTPDEVLVDSDRASMYADPRTQNTKNPGKRVPLDVWGVPSDGPYWGRVQGNNAERRKKHENQLPEVYLERILRAITKPGEMVLDPFCGSGTTAVVAQALGRDCISFEIDPGLKKSADERIRNGAVRIIEGTTDSRIGCTKL